MIAKAKEQIKREKQTLIDQLSAQQRRLDKLLPSTRERLLLEGKKHDYEARRQDAISDIIEKQYELKRIPFWNYKGKRACKEAIIVNQNYLQQVEMKQDDNIKNILDNKGW